MKFEYNVKENEFNNVYDVLKNYFKLSSRLVAKLNKMSLVLLNGNSTYLSAKVNKGDSVSFSLDYDEDNSNIVPVEMKLDILYEDDNFLIVNKPANLAIHPTAYHFDDTLSNGVRFYYDKIGLHKKIRPVNRLDRNTTGAVIFAKNEYMQECLINQMKNGEFHKKYLGLVVGKLDEKVGTIELPIARKDGSIMERVIASDGQYACTKYRVIKEFVNYSLLEFELLTGRTHQIRVHAKAIGHPLLGDDLYGEPSKLISRQALHSYSIDFIYPLTNKPMHIVAPLPEDIEKLIKNKNIK